MKENHPPGYQAFIFPRPGDGGGVLILTNNRTCDIGFIPSCVRRPWSHQGAIGAVDVTCRGLHLLAIALYGPPFSSKDSCARSYTAIRQGLPPLLAHAEKVGAVPILGGDLNFDPASSSESPVQNPNWVLAPHHSVTATETDRKREVGKEWSKTLRDNSLFLVTGRHAPFPPTYFYAARGAVSLAGSGAGGDRSFPGAGGAAGMVQLRGHQIDQVATLERFADFCSVAVTPHFPHPSQAALTISSRALTDHVGITLVLRHEELLMAPGNGGLRGVCDVEELAKPGTPQEVVEFLRAGRPVSIPKPPRGQDPDFANPIAAGYLRRAWVAVVETGSNVALSQGGLLLVKALAIPPSSFPSALINDFDLAFHRALHVCREKAISDLKDGAEKGLPLVDAAGGPVVDDAGVPIPYASVFLQPPLRHSPLSTLCSHTRCSQARIELALSSTPMSRERRCELQAITAACLNVRVLQFS